MLHNKFVIKCGDKTISAFNSVTDAGRHLRQGLRYTKYIASGGKDGYIVKETKLESCNFDKSRGRLYATYSAALGAGDGGLHIDTFGFTPYPDGHELSNVARVEQIIKGAGQQLTVYGTVYLTETVSGLALSPGENALAAFFLGAGALGEAFCLRAGYSSVPYGAGELSIKETAVQRLFSETGLALSAEVPAGTTEAEIYMDGVSVLRAWYGSGEEKVKKETVHAGPGGAFVLEEKFVSGFLENGEIEPQLSGIPDVMQFAKKYEMSFGGSAKLMYVPDSRYFGVLTEKEAVVFGTGSGRPELLARYPVPSGRALLLNDGAVLALGNEIILYKDIYKKAYAFPAGKKAAAIREKDGGCHLCLAEGEDLVRYRLTNSGYEILELKKGPGGFDIFRCGDKIGILGARGDIGAAGTGGQDELKESVLAGLLAGRSTDDKIAFDGYQGTITQSGLSYALSVTAAGKTLLSGHKYSGGCYTKATGDAVEIAVLNPVSAALTVLGSIPAKGLLDVAVAGDYIAALYKDGIALHRIEYSGFMGVLESGGIGAEVMYEYRLDKTKGGGSRLLEIELVF